MRREVLFIVLLMFVAGGCLQKPTPWMPPDSWPEENATDARDDDDAGADAEAFDLNPDAVDGRRDEQDAADTSDKENVDQAGDGETADVDSVDHHDDDEIEVEPPDIVDAVELDADALDVEAIDQTETPDAKDCPPGYGWDPEMQKCVSFCPAEQYFEVKLMKCVYYPCCDLTAAWKVSVLDSDTMNFTIYDLTLGQEVSYLVGFLELSVPLETAECSGSVQKKNFVLTCLNELYSLQLSSSTVEDDGSFSGFYTYNYKDGAVKSGPFNMDKK